MDALRGVCEKLKISEQRSILPSQRRYLNYFNMIHNGFTPSRKKMSLSRLIVNGVPSFDTDVEDDEPVFRPMLEVWQRGAMLYSSVDDGVNAALRKAGAALLRRVGTAAAKRAHAAADVSLNSLGYATQQVRHT